MNIIIDQVNEGDDVELGSFNFVDSEIYGLNFSDFKTKITQVSPQTGEYFQLKGNKLFGTFDAEEETEYEIEFEASYR